jgi:hypothetical protein
MSMATGTTMDDDNNEKGGEVITGFGNYAVKAVHFG